jgi:type VI secretion system protein ImpB
MLELPFVVGVLGDFSGQPAEQLAQVRDRNFVEVNPDNFDSVLKGMKPRLVMRVDNKLDKTKPDATLSVELNFSELEDFEPHRVAEQVPELKKLVELRTKLSDLKGSLQGNPNFEELLDTTIRNTDKRGQLQSEIEKSKGESK